MVRIFLKLVFLIISLVSSFLTAQEFTGIASYKTAAKVSFEMEGANTNDAMQAEMQAAMQKAFQKEFDLKFNKTESVWKLAESLGSSDGSFKKGGMEMQIVMVGQGSNDVLYKNTRNKAITEQTDVSGKMFLIKDSLPAYNWKLENETKQIGEYTCYKATASREITIIKMESENGEDKSAEEKKTYEIVAWYAPEIPVNHGPDNYWGLPGLILELNDGNRTMVCNKLVLNPKEPLVIEEPSKGTRVTREEFRKIMDENLEKMQKMHEGGRKKDGNRSINIKIGG